MTTPTRCRPIKLEETEYRKGDGVLIANQIYIVRGFYGGPKNDFLLVEDDAGRRFKAFLNTCQRIDGTLVETNP